MRLNTEQPQRSHPVLFPTAFEPAFTLAKGISTSEREDSALMTRKQQYKPLAVFNYMATNEAVWHDLKTGTRLAPGAVQNWPTRESEKWINEQVKMLAEAKKKEARLLRNKC